MATAQMDAPDYKVVSILDTRLESSNGQGVTFALEQGAKYLQYSVKQAISFSNQGGSFILDPTGDLTCRDPRILLEVPGVTVTINATNTGGSTHSLITSDNFGLKQYPLTRSMTSVNHQINAASYPFTPYNILDALARLNSDSPDANFYDATQPDLADSYANATGSAINPLGPFSNEAAGQGIFKTRTPQFTVTNNSYTAGTTQSSVITFDIQEPLITYYTNIGSKDRRALYGITNETVQFSLCNNLVQSMIAFFKPVADFTINSITIDLTAGSASNARLHTVILTPPDALIPMIPHQSVYQHPIYELQSFNTGACAAGATLSFNQTVNFNSIPDKILIFTKLAMDQYATDAPDKYLSLESIALTFDNQQPCLTSAIPRKLWEVSTRNGLCIPWKCWNQQVLNSSLVAGGATALYGCGSVFVASPALDLSVRSGAGAGSAGRYVLNIQSSFKNKTGTSFASCTSYVVGVNQGILERNGSVYRDYQQAFPIDIMKYAGLGGYVTQQHCKDMVRDNSFLSGGASIKDLLSKAASWAVEHPDKIIEAVKFGKKALGYGGGARLQTSLESAPRARLFYQ